MKKAIIDAVAEALGMMHIGLETFGKAYSADLVSTYILSIDDLDCDESAIHSAAGWFVKHGDGHFPSAPVFRRQVEQEMRDRFVTLGVETRTGLALIEVPRALPMDLRRVEARKKALDQGFQLVEAEATPALGG